MAAADPGVERITLFGSTAAGVPNSADIDIDIAFEGGDLYRALESTEKCEFMVDVVELARLPRHMQESIRKSGRILFDRDSAKR
jgi:predicted nucleotidyltransferase